MAQRKLIVQLDILLVEVDREADDKNLLKFGENKKKRKEKTKRNVPKKKPRKR